VLVPVTLLGEYYWTARAVDELGEASDWAVPFRFVATGDQDTGPVVDPDSFVGGSGCKGCASSMSATERPTTLWLLALLPGALLVRRRRR
jgi:MYXO-CTERM domain-containing protein